MSTKILEKKVKTLSAEVAQLRSLIIKVVHEKEKDPEGEYRPEFVRGVKLALKQARAGKLQKISSLKELR